MNLSSLNLLLAQTPAPVTTEERANPTGQTVQMFAMLALMGVMFYLVLYRPQQKRQKELAQLLSAVKSGDKIVTSSGIVGVVVAVKEKTVSLRSADTKLEVLKSTITEITDRSGETAEAKS